MVILIATEFLLVLDASAYGLNVADLNKTWKASRVLFHKHNIDPPWKINGSVSAIRNKAKEHPTKIQTTSLNKNLVFHLPSCIQTQSSILSLHVVQSHRKLLCVSLNCHLSFLWHLNIDLDINVNNANWKINNICAAK